MDTETEMKIKKILGDNLMTLAEYHIGDEKYLLAVCKTLDFETLKKLKQIKEEPFVFTKEELTDGLDVFPIDFLNIKQHHTLIYGEDFLKDLIISKDYLRQQLEYEFRSKLIHLRKNYLQLKGKDLENLILSSVPTLIPIFGGLIYLKDLDLGDTNDMINTASNEYGINMEILKEIYDIRQGNAKFNKDMEYYIKYLIEILTDLGEVMDEFKVMK